MSNIPVNESNVAPASSSGSHPERVPVVVISPSGEHETHSRANAVDLVRHHGYFWPAVS